MVGLNRSLLLLSVLSSNFRKTCSLNTALDLTDDALSNEPFTPVELPVGLTLHTDSHSTLLDGTASPLANCHLSRVTWLIRC